MLIRETLGFCIEAACAPQHPRSIAEQFKIRGKAPKVLAAMRCMPEPLLAMAVRRSNRTGMPVDPSNASLLSYGGEAVVYRVGEEHVLKRYSRKRYNELTVHDRRQRHAMYVGAFGSLVVPSFFMLTESPYKKGSPVVGCVQPYIEGEPFFDNMAQANPESVATLQRGVGVMLDRYGCLPDFVRHDNILVDANGRAHIVDTGAVKDPFTLHAGLQADLALLASVDVPPRLTAYTP